MTRPDGTTFTATRTVYGEAAPTPTASNLRGRAFRVYDGAGVLEQEAFDVDGNLVRQSRRLAAAYATTPDWAVLDELTAPADMDAATAALLEAEVFTTEASFDAMGRPVTQTTPDGSVLHLGYGDAGHLEAVAANVRGAVTATDFVTDLRYDARGQRTLVVYGNGTRTSYAYDSRTFRLTQLQTERIADGHLHQDLHYTYDPAGNVTEIRDLAQPIVFTSNAAVSADQRFEYDALYRLVHAVGREHGSQGQPVADDLVPRAAPDDPTGLRLYTEQYLYDAVGNILQQQHAAVGGSWTRHYSYDPLTAGNRLLATSAPGDGPGVHSHTYAHDAHGSMTAMPHLAAIAWGHADRMHSADLGGGGTVHFTYDVAGQRVRKLRVNLAGTSTYERIYLGGFELYREHVGTELRLERQTLHVGDDTGRVCLVETQTIEDALPIATPANVSRYQYGNHLDTVGLELDDTGQLISYEEYHPYGTTAYRAANGSIEVSPSRYRYTGKERDEETGLGYHGARYYASWLGRWTAADPIGLRDGVNRYSYVRGSPAGMRDPSGTAGKPSGTQELRILRAEDLPTDKVMEIGPGGKVEFREPTPAEIQAGRIAVEKANRELAEELVRSLEPRETPRQRARRERDSRVEAKAKAGEPLFEAQGTGRGPGRAVNSDEYGNYSPYLQVVNETQEMYGPDAGSGAGGPADPLINPIVQQGGPAGDKVFGAFAGAGLMKGGFLRGPARTPSAAVQEPAPAAEGGVNLDSSTARALVAQDSPVRHEIKAAIGNRQMVMTETAQAEFKAAVSRLAGPQEAARAERLMGRVNVVPDDPSARVAGLTLTKKVGANDRVIFGTGDKMGIQTLTSDAKFVRGAAAQGVDLNVLIHRAFSFLGL